MKKSEKYLTMLEACEYAKVSRSTIERWRRRKKNPLSVYFCGGTKVLIKKRELDAFIKPVKA